MARSLQIAAKDFKGGNAIGKATKNRKHPQTGEFRKDRREASGCRLSTRLPFCTWPCLTVRLDTDPRRRDRPSLESRCGTRKDAELSEVTTDGPKAIRRKVGCRRKARCCHRSTPQRRHDPWSSMNRQQRKGIPANQGRRNLANTSAHLRQANRGQPEKCASLNGTDHARGQASLAIQRPDARLAGEEGDNSRGGKSRRAGSDLKRAL